VRKFLTLLAPAALLSGCGTYNGGLESVHQPVVERSNFSLDLATAGGSLASGEAARLNGWMGSLRLGYGDRVALEDPSGSGVVRDQVSAQAAKFGLLLTDSVPVTGGTVASGTVRVVISRTTASVPGCPDYSRMYQPDYSASTSSNYGCAMNANLAAMVANPEDLVRGRAGTGVSDPAMAAKAVEALRSATMGGGGGNGGSAGGTGGSSGSGGGGASGGASSGGASGGTQ
jgi:pilus assembly protein CpaD